MNSHSPAEVNNIPQILSFFGLETVVKVVPITDGLGNHSYIVKTSQGEFVIKFLVTQKPVGIENDLAVQKQLLQIHVNTPTYLSNKVNEYIYTEDNQQAVVSKKMSGITPRYASKGLAYSIGRTLALFHKCIITLPHPLKGWMSPDMFGMHTKEAKLLFGRNLPQGITHGDMHLGNILVDPKKPDIVHAIFDFEEVGEDVLLVDLARSIMGVCYSKDEESLMPELIQAEIQGYESVRKLSDDEKTLLPQAVAYAADVCIKWFVDHKYEKYVEQHRKRAKSFDKFSLLKK